MIFKWVKENNIYRLICYVEIFQKNNQVYMTFTLEKLIFAFTSFGECIFVNRLFLFEAMSLHVTFRTDILSSVRAKLVPREHFLNLPKVNIWLSGGSDVLKKARQKKKNGNMGRLYDRFYTSI